MTVKVYIEKVIRGLKKVNNPILTGYQIYYNYISENEGLDGKTPTEACGIRICENKWVTII
jgi:putative transposase